MAFFNYAAIGRLQTSFLWFFVESKLVKCQYANWYFKHEKAPFVDIDGCQMVGTIFGAETYIAMLQF